MTKTPLMLLGLAAVLGAGTACFGLFSSDDEPRPTITSPCADLDGEARAECERRREP
jgi:hypothetical protein